MYGTVQEHTTDSYRNNYRSKLYYKFLVVKVKVRYLSVVGCLNPDLAGNVAIVVIHHHSLV
jgi:hypothetical protein